MSDAARGQVAASAAEVYDEVFVPALFAQWAEPVLDAAGVEVGDAVLDVGCGSGVVARAAARRVGEGGAVVGLDRNAGMLAVASRAPESVAWRLGVAEALPFEDESFDRVLCNFAMMFFDDRRQARREMARALRPGGTVAVATWATVDESPGYTALVQLLRDVIDDAAAEALLAPFCLGTAEAVTAVVGDAFPDVRVARHDGSACFESIESWLRADVRGWTLAERVDDTTYARLLDVARRDLAPYTDDAGRVSFAAPALIATASRPT
jgi:ubiquinone/menaquinone biosynthesis C-methylase UbiE